MLEKKYPVRNGKKCSDYFFVLPDNLAKKENMEKAKAFCESNNLRYVCIDGVWRAVEKNRLYNLTLFCTSVVAEDKNDADKKVIWRNRQREDDTPTRGGGIDYCGLARRITDGEINACIFAFKNPRVNHEKLYNIIRNELYYDDDENVDGESFVCVFTDKGKGQDLIHAHIMSVIKTRNKCDNLIREGEMTEYIDFIEEVSSWIDDLFFEKI